MKKQDSGFRIQGAAVAVLLGLIALAVWIAAPPPVSAQFQGFFAQQTITQTISVTMTAGRTHTSINNIGQAAHSIQLSALSACNAVFTLDGSQDGTTWMVIASMSGTVGGGVSTNGYYPLLRLTSNFEADAGCNTQTATIGYTGYQFPIPPQFPTNRGNIAAVPYTSVASPQLFTINSNMIWSVNSINCSNPGGSTAYLQVNTGTLGAGIFFEVAIPAGGIFSANLSGSPLYGNSKGYLGAATTPGGAVAVGTALDCTLGATTYASIPPGTIASP